MFQSYSLRAAELESQKQRGLFLDKNDITSLLSLLQSWNDSFVSVLFKRDVIFSSSAIHREKY